MKPKTNYRDILTRKSAKHKTDQNDQTSEHKAPSFADLKNRKNRSEWENRKFAHERGEQQRNYFETLKTLTFKQFLKEWQDENFVCQECGERAVTDEQPCAFCGISAWAPIDHEPPEHYGEPEESWQERNQRLMKNQPR